MKSLLRFATHALRVVGFRVATDLERAADSASAESVTADSENKFTAMKAKAEKGDAEAQFQLGWFYCDVVKDYGEAIKWYRKAADQGYAYAQSNLGLIYEDGLGVEKDFVEAAKWYRKAADKG